MRKDDPEFKAVVNEALNNVFSSGEINSIYDKWFLNPVPPKNVNLNFEMSDNLKDLIANTSLLKEHTPVPAIIHGCLSKLRLINLYVR